MINIDILKAKASFAGDIDNLRDELIYAPLIYIGMRLTRTNQMMRNYHLKMC